MIGESSVPPCPGGLVPRVADRAFFFWRLAARGALVFCLMFGTSCAEPPTPTCRADATQPCLCIGLRTGVQTCEDDGTRWGACSCDEADGDADADADADADGDDDGFDVHLLGAVEKGPFVVGSLVVVSLIDGEGNPSGVVFTTHTVDDLGRFDLEVRVPHYAALEAMGFYYNEVTGDLSDSPIALRAFYEAEASGRQEAYINIFTHLANGRVRTHLLTGADFRSAIRQAERALRRNLGVGPAGFDPGGTGIEMNILGGDTDANAYLFAVSSVLAQAAQLRAGEHGSIDSALQELINTLMGDLQDDGELSVESHAELRAAEAALDPTVVMDLLHVRLEELGSDTEVPDIRRIIDRDDDGFVNADDCDDTDAEIYPGATERCNGLDDDCDGIVPEDADGDGYADVTCGGDDCDDLDERSYPGALDVCGDDLDANCLGDVDLPTLGAWTDGCVLAGIDDIARVRGYSTITGSLVVGATIPELIGMECLESVEGDVMLIYNDVLSTLLGLDGLTTVGGTLRLEDAEILSNLDGLGSLEHVGGALEIWSNGDMTSLHGLEGLRVVRDNLLIKTNRQLRSLEALGGLTSAHTISIDNNDVLTNVDGLEGISSLSALNVSNNDILENLDGLNGLTRVNGLLLLGSNDLLANIDGLASVTHVTGAVVIVDNDTLTDLDGLSALVDSGMGLTIWNNDRLPTCVAEALLERLQSLGWDGEYSITGNNRSCP